MRVKDASEGTKNGMATITAHEHIYKLNKYKYKDTRCGGKREIYSSVPTVGSDRVPQRAENLAIASQEAGMARRSMICRKGDGRRALADSCSLAG